MDQDSVIKKTIPLYNEMLALIASLLPFSRKEYIRVLDIGCGTGSLSMAVLKEFPLARVTGVDGSQEMLDAAAAKVKHTTWRIDFLCRDMKSDPDFLPQGEYDAIISAFSLQYLDKDRKAKMLKSFLAALKPEGIFLSAEAVRPSSDRLYSAYLEKWKEFMRSNGMDEEDIGAYLVAFLKAATPFTVNDQVDAMSTAGFRDAECYFKYLNWGVFGGIRKD